jgi:PST family polysaccharide transporter
MGDLKRQVVRGGAVTIVTQAGKVVLRMGSLIVLARLLEPRDFGLVGMVTVLTGVFEIIKEAGLSTVTVQRATITEAQLSTLFWMNMAVGTALAVLTFSLAPYLVAFYREPRLLSVTATLACGFIINGAAVQHSALLQREMRFGALAFTEIAALGAGTLVGIVMAINGYAYWSIVGMTLVQAVVTTACVWYQARWIPGLPQRNVGLRSMMQFGGTVTLNVIVVYVAYNVEKVLLGRFWGAAALGLYGRAYQLIKMPTDLLTYSLGTVAFPALSRLQHDPERLRSYFLKGYSLVLTLTLPMTIACALLADEIILVVLGAKWQGTAPILRLLAPTVLVFAAINPLAWLLYASGRVGRSLKLSLVIAPLVITADVIGLSGGPNGVALAFSTAMLLWAIPHMAWCVHGTSISLGQLLGAVARPMAAGVAAAVVTFFARMAIAGSVPTEIGLAVELIILFVSYTWILLAVMGQKPLYMGIVRELRARRSLQTPTVEGSA